MISAPFFFFFRRLRLVCLFHKIIRFSRSFSHVSLRLLLCSIILFQFDLRDFGIWVLRIFSKGNFIKLKIWQIVRKHEHNSNLFGCVEWLAGILTLSSRRRLAPISSSSNQWRCGNHIAMIFIMVKDWGEQIFDNFYCYSFSCLWVYFSHLSRLQCDACKCILQAKAIFATLSLRFFFAQANVGYNNEIEVIPFTVIYIKNDNCFLFHFPILSSSLLLLYFVLPSSHRETDLEW